MIYQLNNETHWEISPEVMREVVRLVDARPKTADGSDQVAGRLEIGLCNLRSAFECELYRLADKKPITDKQEADPNADLLG